MRAKWLATLMSVLMPWSAGAVQTEPPPPLAMATYSYGADPLQTVDLFLPPAGGRPFPLIVFVHGGGWRSGSKTMGERAQPAHFVGRGYGWASVDYRLVPGFTVEEQAADVAAAVGWLWSRAIDFGFDPARIVLMGHSAGGHLVSLVGADPQWLAAEGMTPAELRAVVTLDAAGLDLATAMAPGGGASGYHKAAFGDDVARQLRLSPSSHTVVPNVPNWLMLYDNQNSPAFGTHAGTLARGLATAGSDVRVVGIAGTQHMRMLNELGLPNDPTTLAVDAFLYEKLDAQPAPPLPVN